MAVNSRNGKLVASFPVENSDQIMLVTDGGQLIRVPVDGIRDRRPQLAGRHGLLHQGQGEGRLRRAYRG